jgi:S1-C subfamily serine protease
MTVAGLLAEFAALSAAIRMGDGYSQSDQVLYTVDLPETFERLFAAALRGGEECVMSQFKEVLSATTKVILALFIWSVLIGTGESAAQEGVADVVKRSSDAVVLIVISNSAGQETALGSGFLISADGEIVTNFHVIKEAHSAIVKLSNGAFFPVTGVLASDADKDLAIIKVSGRNLPFLTLGDIDNLHVGDHVVAIGSPLGLEGTVSDGIVSALRDVAKMRWIQTTAPVSHGNSGGPLLDMNDHVVGVITWVVNLESGQNLNFAAPCSEVKALLANANQQAKSLESVANKSDGLFTEDKVWTSLTSGNDYKIRQDGDYLYVDWVNAPSGGFLRSELKKNSDGKWRGKTRARLPCRNRNMNFHLGPSSVPVQNITNLCSLEFDDVEIDLLSDRRIEGIAIHSESLDCKKCEPKGVEHRPFTWIPK